MAALLEREVRNQFRKLWKGWLDTIQPTKGGSDGIPDIVIMAVPPVLVPIEIKRGERRNGRVFVDTIRPAQVSWHQRFAMAGGRSYFVIGVRTDGSTGIDLYIAAADLTIASRKQGMVAHGHCHLLPSGAIAFTEWLKKILE